MAKKSKGNKGKPPAKSSRRAAARKGKGRGLRSQNLPGMSQVRDQVLDNLCEAIAEDRATIAQARADEQGSIQAALRRMREKRRSSHKHGGVELAFVPGEDKLRVRLTKDNEDSSSSLDDAGGDEGEPDAGEDPNVGGDGGFDGGAAEAEG